MSKETELEHIKSQKRRDPVCIEQTGDLTILMAWLNDEVTSQQIRAGRSWSGNNTNYWAASVIKAAYKRGELKIKRSQYEE